MPTISDITNAAQITGNAALGGYVPDVIAIDARPLELLASYTVAYNKVERAQRQLDAEGQAKELASLAAIDFSKIDPKWRDELAAGFSDIQSYMKKNPDALNYRDNKQGYFEYKRKYNELLQGTTSGKANQILLEKRKDEIKNETDITKKIAKQKALDADVAKTGLNDMLPVEEAYNITFSKLPEPKLTKTTVFFRDSNGVQTTKYEIRDAAKINQQASQFAYQELLRNKKIQETPEYQKASQSEKDLMDGQQQATDMAREKDGWSLLGETAKNVFNDPKFKDANSKISMDLLLSYPETKGLAEQITLVNKEMAQQAARIKAGDLRGDKGQLLSADEYYPIDVTDKDGISGTDLARMQMWTNSAPESQTSDYNYHGAADKKEIEILGNASAERNNTADNKRAIAVEAMGNANARYIAGLKGSGTDGEGAAAQITQQGYNPMASIIASLGKPNTAVELTKLSTAQVGALNSGYVDKDGKLTSEAKKIKISFGVDENGSLALYEMNAKTGKREARLSETTILSNASSWIGTFGKETKGQDVYKFTEQGLAAAINKVNLPKASTPATNGKAPIVSSRADFDKLPKGAVYYEEGNPQAYTKQ